MRLVIQIPCYNEEETLPEVLADMPTEIEGIDDIQILVVDDGSADRTAEVAMQHGATRVVQHRGNRGLAQTFLTGLDTALEMGADIIVNTDGDHQYPGDRIDDLVKPIVEGDADLVIGDRQTQSDPKVKPGKRLFYRVGNFVVRSAAGIEVNDAPSGFRAMSRAFAMGVYLTNPFSYTIETIFAAAENRQPIQEVGIRTNEATRKSRLFKGIPQYIARSASIILSGYSMHNPVKAFGWVSLPFILVGVGLGLRFLYYYVQDPDYSGYIQSLILAAICLVVGTLVFVFGILGGLVRTNRLLLQDIRLRIRRLELESRERSKNT
ncbi:MAG: glycosyltransferase [Myxococcales bacterium]|nr:glycosyltransferase [Myxococcales bacterium]